MAAVERTEIFDAQIESIFEVITNYQEYPDFVEGVNEVEVHESSAEGAKVTYKLNVVKSISYTLKLHHERPHRVSWELVEGDLFKSNNGSWTLKDLGDGRTEVTYALDINFKGLVPKMITNKLTKSSLPAMMQSYHERAKNH